MNANDEEQAPKPVLSYREPAQVAVNDLTQADRDALDRIKNQTLSLDAAGAGMFAVGLVAFVLLIRVFGVALFVATIFWLLGVVMFWLNTSTRRLFAAIARDRTEGKKDVFIAHIERKDETDKKFRLFAHSCEIHVGVKDYLEAEVGQAIELHVARHSRCVVNWQLLS